MISQIRPRSYQRYLALPIVGPILDDFACWSQQRGYTVGTIKNQLKDSRHISFYLNGKRLDTWEKLTRETFDDVWEYFRHDRPAIAGTVRQLQYFYEQTHDFPPSPPEIVTRSDHELACFATYLKTVRGLADSTIRSHLRYLERFLDFIDFESNEAGLIHLCSQQIEAFLAHCSQTLNRYSLQHVVAYLRAFLRFEYGQGHLLKPLHEQIDTPRVYRLEKLPRSIPWQTVNALLASIDRTTSQGRRNYAVLYLIATYGLRACEVVSLTLDDIDWRAGTLHIFQGKTGYSLMLPVTDGAADALIDYLQNGRPSLPFREVFLRIRAPHGRLKATGVTEIFQREAHLSGLDIPFHGAHCLRHAYAVHLLRQGVSVKAIGDVLGHHQVESTCVYLRLAIDDLRRVALDVPEYIELRAHITPSRLKNLPSVRLCHKPRSSGALQSVLAKDISVYLQLHRSLGKGYVKVERVLRSLDFFLAFQCPPTNQLNGHSYHQWGETLAELTSSDRRDRLRIVRNFCLHRQRTLPGCFVPDRLTFPAAHSSFTPTLLFVNDIARLLGAARHLPASPHNPLRSELMGLAIVLLYTSGLRRGELLRLTLADFNASESTLSIRETKFHKERIIPLSVTADAKLRGYLTLRQQQHLPMSPSSPMIWNNFGGPQGKRYSDTSLRYNWQLLCVSLGILTPQGIPPRIHDIRHSFAINALLRGYQNGEDMLVKLPQLATYMGPVSVVSTQRYLPFIEPLRSAASARFEHQYGTLIPLENHETNRPIQELQQSGGAL